MPPDPDPIRVDVTDASLHLDVARLRGKLAVLPPGAPVVVMIHGYLYAPGRGVHCPHQSLLSRDPTPADPHVLGWPLHLGLDGSAGLAIGLGWDGRCSPWRARVRAGAAGAALARLAALVQEMSPGRQVQVIAHSMGARVALKALSVVAPGHLSRLILLAPAESRRLARRALNSPAGRQAQVVNVVTRENDLFDALYEWGLHLGCDTSVGQGMGRGAHPPGWRDLWIDSPAALAALARLGHPVAAPRGRVCHWAPYLRPGCLGLYRALIEGRLPVDALPRVPPTRRWSRLMALRLTRAPVDTHEIATSVWQAPAP